MGLPNHNMEVLLKRLPYLLTLVFLVNVFTANSQITVSSNLGSGNTSCGHPDKYGSCVNATFLGNTVKVSLPSTTISNDVFKLRVRKCSGAYGAPGEAFIKDIGVCGTVVGSHTFPSGAPWIAVDVPIDYWHSGPKTFTATLNSDTGDRFYTRDIQIIKSCPDYTISNVTLPSSVYVGSSISYSYTVDNIGNTTGDPERVKFYLSLDSVLDNDDTYLGSNSLGNIGGGQSDSESGGINLSSTISPGWYYLILKVDPDEDSAECDEENNQVHQVIQVKPPQPDLELISIALDEPEYCSGSQVEVTVSIRNNGGPFTTNFTATLIESDNLTLGSSDNVVDEEIINDNFSTGQIITKNLLFDLPSSSSTSSKYYILHVDSYHQIDELSETNNHLPTNAKIDVFATPTQISPPDISTVSTVNPTLDWSNVANADEYVVVIIEKPSNLLAIQHGTPVSQYTIPVDSSLDYSSEYEWFVGVKLQSGQICHSGNDFWRFYTPCPDTYEPNDDASQPNTTAFGSYGSSSSSGSISSYLTSNSDVDHYGFLVSQNGTIQLDLSSLPDDYDLELWRVGQSPSVASSATIGSGDEQIVYNHTGGAASYYIKVYSYQDNYDCSDPYNLALSWTPLMTPYHLELDADWTFAPDPIVKGTPGEIVATIRNTGGTTYFGQLTLETDAPVQGSTGYNDIVVPRSVVILAGDTVQMTRPTAHGSIGTAVGTHNLRTRYLDDNGNYQLVNSGNYDNPHPFTVIAPSATITLVSPNSGTYAWGNPITVNWTSTGSNISQVDIRLLPENDPDNPIYLGEFEPNNGGGTFNGIIDWCVVPGNYLLQVIESGMNGTIADQSDNYIQIQETSNHSFTLTNPTAGTVHTVDQWFGNITWTDVGIPSDQDVSLELVKGPNQQPIEVIANGIQNSGLYDGYTPSAGLVNGDDYAIKIYTVNCGDFGTIGSVSAVGPTFSIFSTYDGSCNGCVSAGQPDTELNDAVGYLCGNCIVDPQADGDYYLSTPMIKEDVAKLTFAALFQEEQGVGTATYADDFPVPFLDMQNAQPYQRYGKTLSYLEYGDGVSPFTRRNPNYYPAQSITRGQICKVFCEAFNIDVTSIYVPFSDVPASHPERRYIAELVSRGVLQNTTYFRPDDQVTRGEAFLILYRLMTQCSDCLDDKLDDPMDGAAFYDPGNYTPQNLGRHPGMAEGNFDGYSEVGFQIADRGMDLNFIINYNSYLTELPNNIFTYEPLGCGWSHSYHSLIKKIPASTSFQGVILAEPVIVALWPGGSMHYYKDNANLEKITEGNYDEIQISNGEYHVKKKNQVTFVFGTVAGAIADTYYLKSITDRNGNTIQLQYENFVMNGGELSGKTLARLKKVIGTTGRQLSLFYNGGQSDKISSVFDHSLSRTISFAYGSNEPRLREYTDAEGHETDFHYSTNAGEENLLQLVTLPNGNITTNQYADGKLTASATLNSTTNTQQQIDVNWGLQSGGGTHSTMSINDGQNTRDYTQLTNALGKVESIDTEGNDADVEYNDSNNPTLPTLVRVKNGTSPPLETTYVYDDDGNVLEVHQEENVSHYFTYTPLHDIETYENPRQKTTIFGYSGGNLTSIAAPIGTTSMGYDSHGQVEWVDNPEGIRIEYEYDAYGNVDKVKAPLGLTSTADYDAGSRLKEFINQNNQRTTYDYDDRDLTESVTRHMLYPTAQDITTSYSFDGNKNLRSITNANGGVTNLEYNYFDWLDKEQFGSAVRRYEYFTDGKLKKIIRADGTELVHIYDANTNRLTNDGYAIYAYDNLNRLQSVTKDGKAITYTYDNLNRVRTITYDGNTVTYFYDANSNVTRINYGVAGAFVEYKYDDNDRLYEVEDWLGNKTNYYYLLDGRLDYTTLPNSTRTEYFYDAAGRMDSMVNRTNGGMILSAYGFELDNLGNHLEERKTEPYGIPSIAAANESGTHNSRNEILNYGGVQFTHDANGNVETMVGDWNISNIDWDDHDMPVEFMGADFNATYEYDGLGHRRSAERESVTTKYGLDILGMSRVLFETDANGNPTYFYVHGLGMISRIKADDNSERYFHYDFRGSTIAMTDENAMITHQYQYDEFGRTLDAQEENLNRFRFVGGFGVMWENERMLFMRARYYDTDLGRFLSEDPVWSTNLYNYAGNNPSKYIDAGGRQYSTRDDYMYRVNREVWKSGMTLLKDELTMGLASGQAQDFAIDGSIAGVNKLDKWLIKISEGSGSLTNATQVMKAMHTVKKVVSKPIAVWKVAKELFKPQPVGDPLLQLTDDSSEIIYEEELVLPKLLPGSNGTSSQ